MKAEIAFDACSSLALDSHIHTFMFIRATDSIQHVYLIDT